VSAQRLPGLLAQLPAPALVLVRVDTRGERQGLQHLTRVADPDVGLAEGGSCCRRWATSAALTPPGPWLTG